MIGGSRRRTMKKKKCVLVNEKTVAEGVAGVQFQRERREYAVSEFARQNYMYLKQIGRLLVDASCQFDGVISDSGEGYYLIHVTEGQGIFGCRGTRKYELQKGSVLLIKSEQALSIETEESGFSANVIEFNSFNLYDILLNLFEDECEALYLQTTNDEFYQYIYDTLLNLLDEASKENEIWIYESLISLVVRYQKNHVVHQQISLKRKEVSSKQNIGIIKKYMDENFQEKLSLQNIAAKFYINKYYLARLFKAEYGMSVGDYLVMIRLEHAKYLLKTTAMSISEIALRSGFNDLNYFGRFFRNNEHCSPNNYRELHRQSQQ